MTSVATSANGSTVKRFLFPIFLAFAATVWAAEPTVEQRLEALEKQVHAMTQENAELKKQLGLKEEPTPVSVQTSGKVTKLAVGGFLQVQSEFGAAADQRFVGVRDRIFFRRARIQVAGEIADDFEFKAEIDLQGNTLGAAAGHLTRANEIYVGWKKYPFAKLRIGQLKPAFGAEQQQSDLTGMTIERSLASDRISDGRQIGVRVGGDWPVGWLNYTLFIGNGNGANSSANDNSKFARSARVVLTARNEKEHKLLFGVDGFWTDDDGVSKSGLGLAGNLFTGRRAGWGVDAEWRAGDFELTGELLQSRFQPRGAAEFEARGWHLTAGYFLLPRQLQVVVRRETFDPNTAVDGDDARSWTFGLNYFIKGDDLAVKTNYLVGRGPGAVGDEGRWVTRLQVVF